jgi:hypothetical protein
MSEKEMDDKEMDRLRSQKTVGELVEEDLDDPTTPSKRLPDGSPSEEGWAVEEHELREGEEEG